MIIKDLKIKVFISSPYTNGGNELNNVYRQIECSNTLMTYGFYPFVPLSYHWQSVEYSNVSYEDWIIFFQHWIETCDCILRLDGESRGADLEVEYANSINKPVFFSLDDMLNYYMSKL